MNKMQKVKKLIVSGLLTSTMVISSFTMSMGRAVTSAAEETKVSNPRVENGVTTWDKISFGSFEQTAKWDDTEKIKWRILSVNGDSAFVIADQVLAFHKYNDKYEMVNEDEYEYKRVTWEDCSLRKWLNSDFYNDTFTSAEQGIIKETTVVTDADEDYDGIGGKNTKDKVYLLSQKEASNAKYGFNTEFDVDSSDYYKNDVISPDRQCVATDYAKISAPDYTNENKQYAGSYVDQCRWWLRSAAYDRPYAQCINYKGWGESYEGDRNFVGVRPVMNISLSSSLVTDAGKVDSKGKVTAETDQKYANPVVDKNGVSSWDCVYFGACPQTAKYEKEPIEWRVLSVDGTTAYVMSDKILDCRQYIDEYKKVNWEDSDLRNWLNGDFYNTAFNATEKDAIKGSTVYNRLGDAYVTDAGEVVQEKVVLLSEADAINVAYGFEHNLGEYDQILESTTRIAKLTDYAKKNCCGLGDWNDENRNDCGRWWLSWTSSYTNSASAVGSDGTAGSSGGDDGDFVYFKNGVRPTLRIDLSSSAWSYAGTVDNKKESSGDGNKPAGGNSANTGTVTPNENNNSGNNMPSGSTTVKEKKTQVITIGKLPKLTAKKLKKKGKSFNLKASGKGKLTYKNVTKKSLKKYITVNKSGKVTLKKKAKKGTYKIKISAAGNSDYKATSKTVSIKVK